MTFGLYLVLQVFSDFPLAPAIKVTCEWQSRLLCIMHLYIPFAQKSHILVHLEVSTPSLCFSPLAPLC